MGSRKWIPWLRYGCVGTHLLAQCSNQLYETCNSMPIKTYKSSCSKAKEFADKDRYKVVREGSTKKKDVIVDKYGYKFVYRQRGREVRKNNF